jgi:uncharacterized membrane protein YebE (DUF533 family)
MPIALVIKKIMNKSIILTAVAAGGALAYALLKLSKTKKHKPAAPNHKTHKHKTSVFTTAKEKALRLG